MSVAARASIAGIVVAASIVAARVLAAPAGGAPLARMYDDHDWFGLRAAMGDRESPPLYAGVVASAFNRVDAAERALGRAVREASNGEEANEARALLAVLYIRLGRTADAGTVIDDILRATPERDDIRNLRDIFGAFADRPNQRIVAHSRARFSCSVRADGVSLPLTVNDHAVEWLLDTGANVTVLSRSEARRLGVTLSGVGGQAADLAGGSARFQSGTVAHMSIAGTELRNVPVIALPDDQPPWTDLPPARQGALGLPVIAALQTIRWTAPGTCEIKSPTLARPVPPNLTLDGLSPLLRVEIRGRRADFLLDTGNQARTQLWARFAADFPELMARGTRGTARVTQVGGSNERAVTVLPELRIRIGGRLAVIRSANVFAPPVGDRLRAGNIGMEVLSQASSVTIDFRSMSVALDETGPTL